MALFVRFPPSDFPISFPLFFLSSCESCCVLFFTYPSIWKALKVSVVLILYSYNGIRVYHNHISFCCRFSRVFRYFVILFLLFFCCFCCDSSICSSLHLITDSNTRMKRCHTFFLCHYYYIESQWSSINEKIDGKLRIKMKTLLDSSRVWKIMKNNSSVGCDAMTIIMVKRQKLPDDKAKNEKSQFTASININDRLDGEILRK